MYKSVEEIKEAFGINEFATSLDNVAIGSQHPVYGTITKFIDDRPGRVLVELNNGSLLAEFNLTDPSQIENLKSRAFDPAIFCGEVVQTTPQVRVNCSTVVFGKKSEYSA